MATQQGQTIALCMIVKDESHVIRRALESVVNFVDYVLICDTGSTDGTQEVITTFLKEHDIDGEVLDRPWVNFAHNRTECFTFAEGKADYILTLDADEVLYKFVDGQPVHEYVPEIPVLVNDAYDVLSVFGNNRYTRSQFFKNDRKWKWVGVVHEYAMPVEGSWNRSRLDYMCNFPRNEGARSKDPRKCFRDALILENWLIDHPNDVRELFYLGQSYMDDGSPAKAIEPMKKAADLTQWVEEKYMLYLRMGRCYRDMGDSDSAVKYFVKAHEVRPQRREAATELAQYYRNEEQYNMAAAICDSTLRHSIPNDVLFVENDCHTWKIKDEAALAYYYSGRYEDALKMSKGFIDEAPESEKERIIKNIEGYRAALK
jgi:glycosyltransferase involved in cell wall biosynthesis